MARLSLALLVLSGSFLVTGCQKAPPEGTVSGIVTLNGQPVSGGSALIRMEPVDGQTQPNDCAIVDGKYELKIAPGEKKVQIYWRKDDGEIPDTATQGTKPPAPQLFPAKYNDQTELRYTVTEGKQEKSFDIKVP